MNVERSSFSSSLFSYLEQPRLAFSGSFHDLEIKILSPNSNYLITSTQYFANSNRNKHFFLLLKRGRETFRCGPEKEKEKKEEKLFSFSVVILAYCVVSRIRCLSLNPHLMVEENSRERAKLPSYVRLR